jgi:hypothetical protein
MVDQITGDYTLLFLGIKRRGLFFFYLSLFGPGNFILALSKALNLFETRRYNLGQK